MAKFSIAAKLRERDAILKSGLRPEVVAKFVAEVDREIEDMAAQMTLPLKPGASSESPAVGSVAKAKP